MWIRMMLAVGLAAAAVQAEPVHGYEEKTFVYTGGPYENHGFKYRLRAPQKIEPGKRYPLVLFLHGAGERGDDNRRQLKFLPERLAKEPYASRFPCFVIAPQCPAERIWASFHWKAKPDAMRMKPEPGHEMKAVIGMLDRAMKQLPVDPSRVYLTGLSMGGYGTWELASRMPDRFAAAAPICGGGDTSQAERLVGLPVWAWHGADDEVVPPDYSRAMVQAIKKAGGKKIQYTELPGVKHFSWPQAYGREDGVVPWLFKQKSP